MASNNNNKSLFLYTGLIFAVAVLLIVLSFFGQTNLRKNQPKIEKTEEQTQPASGITERAAVLSEENKNLIEENLKLRQNNDELLSKINQNDSLLAANGYLSLGNKEMASSMLDNVDYDTLSSDQQMIYDAVKSGLQDN